MARSRKKTPIFPNTCEETEKDEKRKANRALRRAVRVELDKAQDPEIVDEVVMPEMREVSDSWTWGKDGKRYWKPSVASPDYDYDSAVLERAMRK